MREETRSSRRVRVRFSSGLTGGGMGLPQVDDINTLSQRGIII